MIHARHRTISIMAETFAVSYGYVPEMEERRVPHREAHLEFLRGLTEEGRLLLAGALAEPVDGGWLVVRAESAAAARAMIDADPYAHAGLIRSVTIRSINVAIPAT
jgi:hypothetical protein